MSSKPARSLERKSDVESKDAPAVLSTAADGYVIQAPEDVRTYALVREEGESDADYRRRSDLVDMILKKGGF